MGAPFDYLALLKHHNGVGMADGGQTVGNYKWFLPFISRSRPCSMCRSVRVSTELVASSSTKIGVLAMAARAIFKKLALTLRKVGSVALDNGVHSP